MDLIGRDEARSRLAEILAGEKTPRPLAIASISGPGGVGKTFLLDHALRKVDLGARAFLRIRISGKELRPVGRLVHDLVHGAHQLDAHDREHFVETRKNLEALQAIDEDARAEAEQLANLDGELRKTLDELFKKGAGVQSVIPFTKNVLDMSKFQEAHIEAAARVLEKVKAFRPEKTLFRGSLPLPDVTGAKRRNRLRSHLGDTLADGLIGDLGELLLPFRDAARTKPNPKKIEGADRLLVIVDDYESIAPIAGPFFVDHLAPKLAAAKFETTLIVIGRDRLVDTHPGWRQQLAGELAAEIRLAPFTHEESASFARARGVRDAGEIARLVDRTEGFPYLLASEMDAEQGGEGTALAVKGFFDRTTRWMSATERGWFLALCFVDEVNEESIAAVLPGDDPTRVLEWFKREPSIRSPSSPRWVVMPILRERMRAYVELDSPKRAKELAERAARLRG